MAIVVRDVLSQELDRASVMLGECYAEYLPGPEVPLPPSARQAWEAYRSEVADVRSRLAVSQLVVAVDRGSLLGAVTFYPHAGRRARYPELPEEWAGFRLLGVHPAARREGIGRRLIEECIYRAWSLGAPAVGLHTLAVMTVARRIYRRLGFRRTELYDFSPASGYRLEAYRLSLSSRARLTG
jgi:GNAT superfamily N-acetyltransferase